MDKGTLNTNPLKTSKWTVYFLTFITYATFHSIRAAWSGLKNMFFYPPFNYSVDFLGLIDMIVVFTLAISLSTLGHKIQKYGAKRCLLIGMSILIVITLIIGILLFIDVTSKPVYVILYGFGIGIFSASGWPSCLYLLSQYFDRKNSTVLPIWNGTSQFGDFLALFISDIIIEVSKADGSITLIVIPVLMFIVMICNIFFLPKSKASQQAGQVSKDVNQLNEEKEKSQTDKQNIPNKKISEHNIVLMIKDDIEPKLPQIYQKTWMEASEEKQQKKQQINKPKPEISDSNKPILKQNDQIAEKDTSIKQTGSKMSQVNLQTTVYDRTPVNFTNVWCLPGVTLYVIANAIVKSINVIIMTWLVFYLSMPQIDMKDESRIIAILWTFGVFGGSIIGGKVNPTYCKKKFIVCLVLSGGMFITLERMHQKIYQVQIAISIVICSLSFGIPYNMLNTAVPIMLCEKQEIKHRPGAKPAIMSLMEGFGLGLCAFSILLVPLVGIDYIHMVLSIYCLFSILILATAICMEKTHKNVPTISDTERAQKDSLC